MTQTFDEKGNITTVVGDSIIFEVNNIPTDLDYTLFFRVYDKDDNTVIPEVSIPCNYNSTVTVEVKPYVTDLVSIPQGKKSVTNFYGMKACNFENQVEHTQTVDGVDLNQETKITFMRKRAEGYQLYVTLYEWSNSSSSVYTITPTPIVGDYIYNANGSVTSDTISSVVTVYGEIAGIVVNSTYYSQELTGSYKWTYEGTSIYTHSYPPAVGDTVYDEEDEALEDTISAITTSDNKVASITVDSVTYARDESTGDSDSDSDSDGDNDTDTDNEVDNG